MDNQKPENKPADIEIKETIISLKKTIKKLQLTLERINQSEIQKFPTIEITNTFIESSNNLINNIKLAPRFKVQDNSETIPKNVPENLPSRKKRLNFDFRLGALTKWQTFGLIALVSIIIILGICWTLINPNLEIDNSEDKTKIVAIETPPNKQNPPDIDTPDNQTKTENIINSETNIKENVVNDKPDIEKSLDNNSTQKGIVETPPAIIADDTPPQPEKIEQPIPDKEVEIIIEQKTVSALTIEQTLYDNIQEQIDQITDKYGKNLIINLKANFSENNLLITLTQNWYQMNSNEQDNFVNDVYDIGRLLYFNKINFQDSQGNLVARNAVIGDKIIITQR
ncbi:DNA segregation ATPase FtsK/SpoIIIE-related protein [Cyanobacterium sp. HL-69]|uniref:hypothetical protein n=1 Tax=Cyanobacterium sp. HL-69 TaxID=2054282 RepID=UPI000CA14022|nr:DNA segregation ATPase FtsK/SpoIIIE-related protein [Cyanobacterium sp. HL-69]